jgi:hypothetical protein
MTKTLEKGGCQKMTTAKVAKPTSSAASGAAKNEVDDLFATLQAAKKEKVAAEQKPATKTAPIEPRSQSDVSEIEEDEEVNVFSDEDLENELGSEGSSTTLKKGLAYNAQVDDFDPLDRTPTGEDDDDFFDSRGKKRKSRALTEDGLPIFTPKELKIGLGGDTDLCPFDCNCCF